MHRKQFIKSCSYACLGATALAALAAGCISPKQLEGSLEQSGLTVPLSSFVNKDQSFKQYIVVHQEHLKYPICLYRFNEKEYVALWMRCSHQGAELQVFGDRLVCPAHDSAFDQKGIVQNGPADQNLRTFPVIIQNQQIKILLQ